MNRPLFKYHPNIGHTFIPNLKTRVMHEYGGYLIKVNQAGFRSNREFEPVKKPGVFRILLFGDSFTAADGVSNAKRYSDVLEILLPGLEVYNFGLPGSGTDQQYLIFQEIVEVMDHDLLLISVSVENIRRIRARYKVYQSHDGKRTIYPKPYFSLASDGSFQRHHFPVPKGPLSKNQLPPHERHYVEEGGRFNWLYRTLGKFDFRAIDFAQRISRYQPLPAYDSPQNPDWLLMKTILTKWVAESRKPTVICPIPVHQYVEQTANSEACQARFRELGETLEAKIHDPLPDYWKRSKAERRLLRFQRDPHPSPAGHRLLAESLAPYISDYMDRRID